MIRINLLGEKVDNTLNYAFQLLVFVSGIFFAILLCFFANSGISHDLKIKGEERDALSQRVVILKKKTKEVEDLEKNKDLLRQKLTTIATLKARKQGPVHILDDLNLAVPERAWVTSVSQKDDKLIIEGVALDNQTVAEFMRSLGQSKYFQAVDLNKAVQVVFEEETQSPEGQSDALTENVKLQRFSINAKLADLLSLRKKKQEVDKDPVGKEQKN